MKTLSVTLDCRQCGGTGSMLVGPSCSQPASACCGGCYSEQSCVYCDGDGLILYSNSGSYAEYTTKVIRIYNRLVAENTHPKFKRGVEDLMYSELEYEVECNL